MKWIISLPDIKIYGKEYVRQSDTGARIDRCDLENSSERDLNRFLTCDKDHATNQQRTKNWLVNGAQVMGKLFRIK